MGSAGNCGQMNSAYLRSAATSGYLTAGLLALVWHDRTPHTDTSLDKLTGMHRPWS